MYFLFFRGPEDTINDCKILFIEEMYKIEKPGAYPLTFGDGDFKSMFLFIIIIWIDLKTEYLMMFL